MTELQASDFSDAYLERPIRWNLFLEDRLDLGDVVLVGGVRFDAYASRASRDLLLDTIAGSPTFGEYLATGNAAQYGAGGNSADGRPLVTTRPDGGHGYLSPHIQVSFPVTTRTNFRLSYAHQVQPPDFGLVLDGVNFGGTGTDLDFGKTILFEFGVRHAFSDDMVLDIAAYNKDNLAVAAARTFPVTDPFTGAGGVQGKFTNADYGNTRGIDVRLDRRIGSLLNGTISYTYQNAKSTGSDPFSNQNAGVVALEGLGGAIGPPPQAILPTNFSRPHNLAGAVAITFPPDWKRGTFPGTLLRNLGLFAVFRYASGTPYTTCSAAQGNEDRLSGDGCSQGAGGINGCQVARLAAVRSQAHEGVRHRLGWTHRVPGRPEPVQLCEHPTGLQHHRRHCQFGGPAEPLVHRQFRLCGRGDMRRESTSATGPWTFNSEARAPPDAREWLSGGGLPAAPNCVYLIRAEERYGNGDHVFDLDEQRRASDALYAAVGRTSHLLCPRPP